MAAPQNFRTAFNGFHREDVVHYLEYINAKHNTEVNQLTSQLESLRAQLDEIHARPVIDLQPMMDTLKEQLEQTQAEKAALEQEVDELKQTNAALEQELEQSRAVPAPAAEPVAEKQYREEELEAYRRAERTERLARERADQLYRQTNGVLADATAKVDGVVAEVSTVADQVMAQLAQLQNAVTSSKKALQDAADIMYTLRPGNREL